MVDRRLGKRTIRSLRCKIPSNRHRMGAKASYGKRRAKSIRPHPQVVAWAKAHFEAHRELYQLLAQL